MFPRIDEITTPPVIGSTGLADIDPYLADQPKGGGGNQ